MDTLLIHVLCFSIFWLQAAYIIKCNLVLKLNFLSTQKGDIGTANNSRFESKTCTLWHYGSC